MYTYSPMVDDGDGNGDYYDSDDDDDGSAFGGQRPNEGWNECFGILRGYIRCKGRFI